MTSPLPCLPPVSWLAQARQTGHVVLDVHENYQKGTLRNRYYIAGPNGPQRLSIPLVKGKNQQQNIREVRIAYDEPWQRQHWRSIRTAYGNAPYWDFFSEALAPFFEKKHPFLFDFNLELLQWWLKESGCPLSLTFTESYTGNLKGDDRVLLASNPEEWPAGFRAAAYPQVFLEKQGFLPNLSGLDLLFCSGKRATEILEKSWLPS
ncbi:MAG: WbqC family protein [Saprospiraceae bacterium]|nr:WbqC family protein [Saprospiraceae bacterium]